MRVTTSLDGDLEAHVEEIADEEGLTSNAEVMRQICRRSRRLDDVEAEVERLREEIESLEAEKDELRRMLKQANSREDDVQELATFASREERRRRERQEASVFTRLRWALVGRDLDDEE